MWTERAHRSDLAVQPRFSAWSDAPFGTGFTPQARGPCRTIKANSLKTPLALWTPLPAITDYDITRLIRRTQRRNARRRMIDDTELEISFKICTPFELAIKGDFSIRFIDGPYNPQITTSNFRSIDFYIGVR